MGARGMRYPTWSIRRSKGEVYAAEPERASGIVRHSLDATWHHCFAVVTSICHVARGTGRGNAMQEHVVREQADETFESLYQRSYEAIRRHLYGVMISIREKHGVCQWKEQKVGIEERRNG